VLGLISGSGRSFFWPGIGSNERILAECLDDLAQLVSEREALAAARALMGYSDLEPVALVQASMEIAADICIYTNRRITVETL